MKIGELFVALGFDVDDAKLNEFSESIAGLFTGMTKLSLAAAGSLFALNKFAKNSAQMALGLTNFNEQTDQSIKSLQKWQAASILTNAAASADEVTASFEAMSKSIADVVMGKGGGEFAMLGVPDVRGMSVAEVLEELRRNFDQNVATWGYQQTIDLMTSVGFNKNMIQALKLPEVEFEALTRNKFVDEDQIRSLRELADANRDLKFQWDFMVDIISSKLAPSLARLSRGFAALFGIIRVGTQKDMPKKFVDGIAQKQIDFVNRLLGIDGSGQSLAKYHVGDLNSAKDYNRYMERMVGGVQAHVNNVWNIQSNGDPVTLADMIAFREQQVLNRALADQNKGSKY